MNRPLERLSRDRPVCFLEPKGHK